MVIEGQKNPVAPAPLTVKLSTAELAQVLDGVRTGLDRYGARTDPWGKGMLGTADVPGLTNIPPHIRPLLAGKCGEYAIWRLATDKFGNVFPPVDFRRLARGDGGVDLQFGRAKIQAKTRLTSRTNLVKHRDEHGVVQVLVGDAHVFCRWDGSLRVDVLGWLPTRQIPDKPIAQSNRGGWFNYVIDDCHLLPMSRFWAELEWRGA